MGKTCKVVVCGPPATGKTALLEQLIYGNHVVGSQTFSTIEDIYVANIETDRGTKEKVHFFDTAGLESAKPELPKQYLNFADGFVLVYDVTSKQSFDSMDRLKRDIDRHKEKKEAVIIAVGNKCDLKDKKMIEFNTANKWAQNQKVRLWEVSVMNRQSLIDPFAWLTSKMTAPPSKSTFTTFIGGNKRGKTTTDS